MREAQHNTNLTRAQVTMIRSLATAKGRNETGLFVAEGPKLVQELNATLHCEILVACGEQSTAQATNVYHVSCSEFERISGLKAPQGVLAVFRIPHHDAPTMAANTLTLALDGVQDPGNLGTILRLADWFGVRDVVCSPSCASAYNPKTVQACMGALARVRVHTLDLPAWMDSLPQDTPIYGTHLDGTNIYAEPLSVGGVIVMGNEGKGISQVVSQYVTRRLLIPNYPVGAATTESLNVATATAIVLSEFRRRI